MRELRLMAVALLAALPVTAADQTARWIVRDTDGAVVGPVLQASNGPELIRAFEKDSPVQVARRIRGKWIELNVTRNAVWGTRDSAPLLFEDYYCSGPALLDAPRTANEVHRTVVFDTDVFWPTGPAESRTIRAKGVLMRDPAQCTAMLIEPNLCCTVVESEEARFVAEVTGVYLAQLGLRPPFRLEPIAPPQGK